MKHKRRSISVVNLQKNLIQETRERSRKNQKFIPFVNQRRLGRLIEFSNNNQDNKNKNNQHEYAQINFKNFSKVYHRMHAVEQARYSHMTRRSQQQDLITFRNDWKINTIKVENRKTAKSLVKEKQCCLIKIPQKIKITPKFDKMDEQIYKRVAVSKPQGLAANPEIAILFQHYVKTCQLNENIRRNELISKHKY